jgi:hypothetical protein
MDPPKSEYLSSEKHYIMTDDKGYIVNVTDGLFEEMGLHPKFFNYNEEDVHSLISIEHISSTIMDSELLQSLEYEGGLVVSFDTSNILERVDFEKLNFEDVVQIRQNLGKHQAFV